MDSVKYWARGHKPVPSQIFVQGLKVEPGDRVLVKTVDGKWVERTYLGLGTAGHAWMVMENISTHPHHHPGPYRPHELRHPDILSGIAKTIDDD